MSATSLSELFQRPAPVERESSRFFPEEGWLPIGLLLVIVLSTIWSIDQAHWVEGTGVLFPIALGSILAGLLLARTRIAVTEGKSRPSVRIGSRPSLTSR